MSFSFQWPRFSDQFHADAIEMLNAALNKGPKPPVIADKIEVVELEMGTQVRSFVPASQCSALAANRRLMGRVPAPRTRNSRHRRSHYGSISRNISSHLFR